MKKTFFTSLLCFAVAAIASAGAYAKAVADQAPKFAYEATLSMLQPVAKAIEGWMFSSGMALSMLQTFDQATVDSTGVFFQAQLTRIDPILNQPLAEFTWSRDIDIGSLDIGDETTAFDSVKYTAVGGVQPAGKSFIGIKTTEIGNVGADMERRTAPTFVWAEAIQKTVIELAQADKLGRNLDSQLLDAMNMKRNVDLQNQAYLGDTLQGVRGLVNSTFITADNVALNAAAASRLWTAKTDDEVLQDVNTLVTACWAQTGFAIMPRRLGLPPAKFAQLVSRKIVNGSMSLAKYLAENSIAMTTNGVALELVPMRELIGVGVGATDRMIAYTKRADCQRLPLSAMQSTPMQHRDLYQRVVYYFRVGIVELIKPETLRYADGF